MNRSRNAAGVVVAVDPDKCVRCGLCLDACPFGAISLDEEVSIDAAKCAGCGACIDHCVQGAISLQAVTALKS